MKIIEKVLQVILPVKEEQKVNEPPQIPEDIKNFLATYTVALNEESPAQNRQSYWSWDNRYSTMNIIGPTGVCYAGKVDYSVGYMKPFSEFMKKMGIERDALFIATPYELPNWFTEQQKEAFEALPMYAV